MMPNPFEQTLAIIVLAQRRRRKRYPVAGLWLQCFRPDDAPAVELAGRWIVNPSGTMPVANQ